MNTETRHRSRLSINLVAFCVFLAWLAFAETQNPLFIENTATWLGLVPADESTVGSVAPPPPLSFAAGPRRAPSAVDAFSGIAARTLFNPTRRPIEPPPDVKPVPVVKPSQFSLVGVFISDGVRMALIRRSRASDYIRVEEGQVIDGWRIERIVPDRVVISKGGTREELVLRDQPPPRATPRRTPRKSTGQPQPTIRSQ